MKRKSMIAGALVLSTCFTAVPATYAYNAPSHTAKVGETAPSWSLSDTMGHTHSLKEYAGKFVVLEWTNNQCPYVQKHYRTGNMQSLQKYATSHGVVWLSIVSSAPGHEGYVTASEGEEISKRDHSYATAKLLDTTGQVGREYNAKTTPDMMIIDPKGVLIYSGGIDDRPTTDDEDVKTAHNYVKAALQEALAGKPVSIPVSQPYGCSVKYGS
jgi:peroxiredoxin